MWDFLCKRFNLKIPIFRRSSRLLKALKIVPHLLRGSFLPSNIPNFGYSFFETLEDHLELARGKVGHFNNGIRIAGVVECVRDGAVRACFIIR